jgi:hypothetical protein
MNATGPDRGPPIDPMLTRKADGVMRVISARRLLQIIGLGRGGGGGGGAPPTTGRCPGTHSRAAQAEASPA